MRKRNRLHGTVCALCLAAVLAGCAPKRPSVVYQINSSSSASQADGLADSGPEDTADAADGRAVPDSRDALPDALETAAESTICVHVCGEVRMPGVYEIPAGSRIWQALQAAGGLTEEADDRALNQAEILSDGDQVIVWSKTETASAQVPGQLPRVSGGSTAYADGTGGRVNLNTAGRESLMTLPGIGEARADAILQYRADHGGFSSAEELMNIDGIGAKSFQKLRELITV